VPPLARRNLLHDKVRLAVTLTGIVFAVLLIAVELGLFMGFATTTSNLIDNAGADLWVTSKLVPYIEQGVEFSERKLYQVRTAPGVADAEKLIVRWSGWRLNDGREESVQIIGFNPDAGLGRPWNIVAGSVEDLKNPESIMVDEFYKQKLGVSEIGEVFEINGHRARVAGFTRGIRAFTTSPYVFTTFKRAQDYTDMAEDQTTYVLVKIAAGGSLEQVRQNILKRVKNIEVLTGPEFSRMTEFYWMFTTGAGVAVLLAAVLGLVVGFVIVTQTIYATTMDHIREFGTLKAMGAPNLYIYKVIMKQALMSGAIGYVLGMIVGLLVERASQSGGAAIIIPWQMSLGLFFLTLFMCCGAALVSVNKVTRLDPAIVFKN
jgi:putative ABC transport system permease protein